MLNVLAYQCKMPPMTKHTFIVAISVLIALVIAAVLFGVARNRGIITFNNGIPQFSFTKLSTSQPSPDRPIQSPADFQADAREMFNTNLAKAKDTLTKDPSDVSVWFDLAVYYRMVGDHEGAVEIWEYISATHPQEGISLHNLGEYNFHTAKNYPLAESYYRKSIAVVPQLASNYTDLHEMYRYVYKQDTTAAADALKEGIGRVTGSQAIDLEITLGTYYAENGNTADAIAYITKARDSAKALGNTRLVDQLNKQLAALKK